MLSFPRLASVDYTEIRNVTNVNQLDLWWFSPLSALWAYFYVHKHKLFRLCSNGSIGFPIICICHSSCIHLPVDGHLSGLQIFT